MTARTQTRKSPPSAPAKVNGTLKPPRKAVWDATTAKIAALAAEHALQRLLSSDSPALPPESERLVLAAAITLGTGNLREACTRVQVDYWRCALHRDRSPEFALALERALAIGRERGADDLERAAISRARRGSDQLLMFMLRAMRPTVYREGSTGPPLVQVVITGVTDGQPQGTARLAAALQKQLPHGLPMPEPEPVIIDAVATPAPPPPQAEPTPAPPAPEKCQAMLDTFPPAPRQRRAREDWAALAQQVDQANAADGADP